MGKGRRAIQSEPPSGKRHGGVLLTASRRSRSRTGSTEADVSATDKSGLSLPADHSAICVQVTPYFEHTQTVGGRMPGSDRSRKDGPGKPATSSGDAKRERNPSSVRPTKPLTAELPSGRTVALVNADPHRPWQLEGSGGVYHVARARRGDSTRRELYRAGQSVAPLTLDEADAKALLLALNSNLSRRAKRRD